MNALKLRIDLAAIAHNTRQLRRQAGGARLMCVVKADAYNHGAAKCVPVMEANGADAFGCATIAEAASVAKLTSKPVMAWLWAPGEELVEGIEMGVPSLAHLRTLIDAPFAPTVHLMIDTGMNRSGVDEEQWPELFAMAAEAQRAGQLRVAGLMSHFACADNPADPYTDRQLATFRESLRQAHQAGLEGLVNHVANSPATWTREDARFEQIRPGIGLYGLEAIDGTDNGLRPAMSWVATVTAVKPIRAGEPVSYSGTWTAPEDGFTAVVPAGYADGVMRIWQDRMDVTIRGARYPQVGRVCMDQIVVWLGTNEAGVAPGDEAVLFGVGGVSADEFALRANTIHYEVLCAPKGRTVREYGGRRVCETREETQALGRELGETLHAGDVVILDGPLGAGKTTLTQGIAEGMQVKGRVTSPTFTIAREHRAKEAEGASLIHVDAYRLLGEGGSGDPLGELDALDLESELDRSVVVAEWGGDLAGHIANEYLLVTIDRTTLVERDDDSEGRIITWRWVHAE